MCCCSSTTATEQQTLASQAMFCLASLPKHTYRSLYANDAGLEIVLSRCSCEISIKDYCKTCMAVCAHTLGVTSLRL